MRRSLLETIAKFAEGPSAGMRANDWIGSTAYALGAGDDAPIPASKVFRHSILPYAISTGIGTGIGAAAGWAAPQALEHLGVIHPADPVGSATDVITAHGGHVTAPPTPTPDPTADDHHIVDHPLVDQKWSDRIRDHAMTVGTVLGGAAGQNWGRKEQFMHGVRDALEERIGGAAPWTHEASSASPEAHIPWKTKS